MINNELYYPYDFEYSDIPCEIRTPVKIFSSRNSTEGICLELEAIWDTGATNSVIAPEIAQQLCLDIVDNWNVSGINSEKASDVVVAAIILPNEMFLKDRRFSVCNIPGADMLIGMDIISLGDFNISNARGKTHFSFVIPSYKEVISYSKLIDSL